VDALNLKRIAVLCFLSLHIIDFPCSTPVDNVCQPWSLLLGRGRVFDLYTVVVVFIQYLRSRTDDTPKAQYLMYIAPMLLRTISTQTEINFVRQFDLDVHDMA
jgi:hypothetical protein